MSRWLVLLLVSGCGLDWTVPAGDGTTASAGTGSRGGESSVATGAGGVGGSGSSGVTSATATGPTTSASSTSASTSASSGSGGAPPMCDQIDCNACIGCALQPSGPCGALEAICQMNSECVAIENCAEGCGNDPGCFDVNCWGPHPSGQNDYDAVDECLFCYDACSSTCGGPPVWCP